MALNDMFNTGKDKVVAGAKGLMDATSEAGRSTWESAKKHMGLGGTATPAVTGEVPQAPEFAAKQAAAAAKAQAELTPAGQEGLRARAADRIDMDRFTAEGGRPAVEPQPRVSPQRPFDPGAGRPAPNQNSTKAIIDSYGVSPQERVNGGSLSSTPAKPGLLTRAGQIGGVGLAGYGAYQMAKANNGEERGDAVDNMVSGGLMASKHPVMQIAGAAYQGLAGLRDMGMNAMWRSTFGEDYKKPGTKAVAPTQPAQAAQPPMPAAPSIREAPVVPEQPTWNAGDIDTNKVPPSGAGSVRGGNRPAVSVFSEPTARDLRANQLHAQGKAVHGMGNNLDESTGGMRGGVVYSGSQGGVGGELAGLIGQVAKARGTINDYNAGVTAKNQDLKAADLGLRTRVAESTIRKQQADMEKDERGVFEGRLTDVATRNVDPNGEGAGLLRGDQYKSKIESEKARLKSEFEYSTGRRDDGKKFEQLSRAEQNDLFTLSRIKSQTEKARGDFGEKMRSYFGGSRADSKNLYSYGVTKAERANDGGYVLTLGNGNKVKAEALSGGGFNLFGPNDPVDADLAEAYKKQVDAAIAEADKKGK